MAKKSISTIILAAVTLLLAGGCGGSGGGGNGGGGNPGNLAGEYTGAANLQSGFLGEITFTVEEGGATSGHLVVSTESTLLPHAGEDDFAVGSWAIFGGVNNGEIDLQGTANGNFTVTGHVQASGNTTVTITKGSTTYTGTIHKGSGGTVTASVDLEVTENGNMTDADFPTGAVEADADPGEGETSLTFIDAEDRMLTITIPDSLEVGEPYTLDSLHRFVSYREVGSDIFGETWSATSGTFTLTARNGTHFSLTLTNVVCPANTMFGSATGTVKLNGTLSN